MVKIAKMMKIGVVLLALGTSCHEDSYEPIRVIVDGISPAGGPPGTVISVIGRQFSPIREENTVTIDGRSAKVLFFSDTLLTVQIPERENFAKVDLVVTRSGLLPDTTQVIVSENPLAQVTSLSPNTGPTGTIVTVSGTNFNLDTAAYAVVYAKPDATFFVPTNEDDGTFRNKLRAAYPDSLLIQIPEGFPGGRIRILTATVGKPQKTAYELTTPTFTVK